jgi:hypothetical protein
MKNENHSDANADSIENSKNVFDWLRIWLLKQAQCEQLFSPSDYMNVEE